MSPKLPRVSGDELLRALKRLGFVEQRQRGSHVHLKHPTKPGKTTVPHSKRDLPKGTLKSLERQSGVKLR